MASFDFQSTPNPNSLKITTDAGAFTDDGLASYTSPDEAEGDPLGHAIIDIDGVMNVLILPDFLTVSKAPDASWDAILPVVRDALEDHFATKDT